MTRMIRIWAVCATLLSAVLSLTDAAECREGHRTVTGSVFDRHGVPLAGVSVIAANTDTILASAITDELGRYRLHVAEGTNDSLIVKFSCAGFKQQRKTVPAGQEQTIIDVVLRPETILVSLPITPPAHRIFLKSKEVCPPVNPS